MNPPASSKSPTSRKKPRIMRHLILSRPKVQPAINGVAAEIQPHQHLIGVLHQASRLGVARKPLTLQNAPSIRAPMAAGAIPPPLFFERRRPASIFASHGLAFSGNVEQHTSVDHAVERPAR